MAESFANPFKPSSGHMPPYLAGRTTEREDFKKLLRQSNITDNLIITGLRGVGKSVLLESFRPVAREAGWLWTGDDFTEAVSLSENAVTERLLTDLSLTLGPIFVQTQMALPMGFGSKTEKVTRALGYSDLRSLYDSAPGLATDKLKAVLRYVGSLLQGTSIKGIIFAYDEAQNLSDRADQEQYPLSLLLDVFQSVQRSPGGLPFMLALTGLPTLFPKLNETRTYTERMFEVFPLDKLSPEESREAILKPVEGCPVTFGETAVDKIVEMSGGYPYFIQFICKEFFDMVIAKMGAGEVPVVPRSDIIRKLDQRFFSGRWDKASDRQREFMMVAAMIPGSRREFTVKEIVQTSRDLFAGKEKSKAFSEAAAGMMLKTLDVEGFIFRNRRGKYSFTVPLLDEFIIRQMGLAANLPAPFASPSAS